MPPLRKNPLLTSANLRQKSSPTPAYQCKHDIVAVQSGDDQTLRGSVCPPARALLVNLKYHP